MRLVLSLLLLLPALALAQAPVLSVSAAPSGSCVSSTEGRVQLVKSTGAIYCCNSGTWGSCGGSSNADTLDGYDSAAFLNPGSPASATDLNTSAPYGFSTWGTTTTGAPSANSYGSVLSWSANGGTNMAPSGNPQRWIYQLGIDTQNRISFRQNINGGGWTPWGFGVGGDFAATGNVTAYGTISDLRLKRDVQPITGALGKTLRLRGVTHEWRDEKLDAAGFSPTRGTVHGLIAQDVQAVLPDAVYEAKGQDGETYLGVRYERVVPLLVEAIRELEARVAKLETER